MKKALRIMGIIAISLTFFYMVVWPPIIRNTCYREARDATLKDVNSVYLIKSDTINRYGLVYTTCVNYHGLAD